MLINNLYAKIFHYTQGEPLTVIGLVTIILPLVCSVQWLVNIQTEDLASQDIKFVTIVKTSGKEVWVEVIRIIKDYSLTAELIALSGQQPA